MNLLGKSNIILLTVIALAAVLSFFFFFRIDLTSDKRYSISPQTKQLMKKAQAPVKVTIYLDGDLNPGFLRLKKSTEDLLEEMSVYTQKGMNIQFVNPSIAETTEERTRKYAELESLGMTPTAIYERDKEGKKHSENRVSLGEVNIQQ